MEYRLSWNGMSGTFTSGTNYIEEKTSLSKQVFKIFESQLKEKRLIEIEIQKLKEENQKQYSLESQHKIDVLRSRAQQIESIDSMYGAVVRTINKSVLFESWLKDVLINYNTELIKYSNKREEAEKGNKEDTEKYQRLVQDCKDSANTLIDLYKAVYILKSFMSIEEYNLFLEEILELFNDGYRYIPNIREKACSRVKEVIAEAKSKSVDYMWLWELTIYNIGDLVYLPSLAWWNPREEGTQLERSLKMKYYIDVPKVEFVAAYLPLCEPFNSEKCITSAITTIAIQKEAVEKEIERLQKENEKEHSKEIEHKIQYLNIKLETLVSANSTYGAALSTMNESVKFNAWFYKMILHFITQVDRCNKEISRARAEKERAKNVDGYVKKEVFNSIEEWKSRLQLNKTTMFTLVELYKAVFESKQRLSEEEYNDFLTEVASIFSFTFYQASNVQDEINNKIEKIIVGARKASPQLKWLWNIKVSNAQDMVYLPSLTLENRLDKNVQHELNFNQHSVIDDLENKKSPEQVKGDEEPSVEGTGDEGDEGDISSKGVTSEESVEYHEEERTALSGKIKANPDEESDSEKIVLPTENIQKNRFKFKNLFKKYIE